MPTETRALYLATSDDRAEFNRWRLGFFIAAPCFVLIALAVFAQGAASNSVDPPHRPAAGDQHSPIEALLAHHLRGAEIFNCNWKLCDPDCYRSGILLMLISVCLGACFVWAFWEIEEARRRRERNRELGREARRSPTPSH